MTARRIVDILMTLALILLMSLQVTDYLAHEYIGMVMVTLVIAHQYLNRSWFKTLLRGRYGAMRVLSLAINIALIVAFIVSAISGMIISETFDFSGTESFTEWGRTAHVCSSYWAFVIMGLHIGMHWGMIAGRIKSSWPGIMAVLFAGWGMYSFICANIADYLTLRNVFVFLDYDKNPALVIAENVAMLSFCVLAGYQLCRFVARPKDWLKPSMNIAGMCAVCAALLVIFGRPETF